MNALKNAIMKRRSRYSPEMEEDAEIGLGVTDEMEQEELDDKGETGLAPLRAQSELENDAEVEEEGEDKMLSNPEEDALMGGPNMGPGGDSMGEGDAVMMEDGSKSGLSADELSAIADDLLKGLNPDKLGIMGRAAMKMKQAVK